MVRILIDRWHILWNLLRKGLDYLCVEHEPSWIFIIIIIFFFPFWIYHLVDSNNILQCLWWSWWW